MVQTPEVEEKDEKIINLEASIEYLQQALIQKEEDLMKKEEIITKLRKRIDIFNTDSKVGIDAVNKFEKRLSQLMSGEESSKKKRRSFKNKGHLSLSLFKL